MKKAAQTMPRAVALVLACLLVLVGAGCLPQVTPTPEPVSISVACPQELQEEFEALAEAFHKEQPHITVELVTQGLYQLADADVYLFAPFELNFVKDQLKLRDLAPLIDQDESFNRADLYPGMLELFRYKEETLGVPFVVDVRVMYYNRDLFDQYHVDPPTMEWTRDDFARLAKKLYRPAQDVFGYAPDSQLLDPLTFIYQHGGRIYDDFSTPTRTTLDDPLNVEALQWYIDLMYKNESAATPLQARRAYGVAEGAIAGIRQGKLGMWSGWLSEQRLRGRKNGWPANSGIVPLPRDVTEATLGWVVGGVIAADAQSLDACWKWIVYLSKQPPGMMGMPVRKSVTGSEAYRRLVGKDVADVAAASIEHALLFSMHLYETYDGWRLYQEAAVGTTEGAMSPQEALMQAQQKSNLK